MTNFWYSTVSVCVLVISGVSALTDTIIPTDPMLYPEIILYEHCGRTTTSSDALNNRERANPTEGCSEYRYRRLFSLPVTPEASRI